MAKAVRSTLLLGRRSARTKKLCRIADAARDRKDWRTACDYYRQAVETSPAAFHIWVQLGHAAKEMQNFGAAAEAYKAAERLNPDDLDLKIQMGHFYKMLNRREEAYFYYKSAIAQGSSDIHALNYLSSRGAVTEITRTAGDQDTRKRADAARDARDTGLAARLYHDLLQTEGEDASILVQLGNCMKDLGRFDAADKAYARALELYPTDADCYLQRGHLMKLTDNLKQAIEYYSKSDELEPTRPDARMELERLRSAQTQSHRGLPVASLVDLRIRSRDLPDMAVTILNDYRDAVALRRR
jgi:tetratricopeptide (TPR) repeat protein